MRYQKHWAVLLVLAVFAFAFDVRAQTWRAPDGTLYPPSDSRKTVEGLSAMLLVTPDRDWLQKWRTPPDVTPSFRESDSVARGDTITILVFLAGPKMIDGAIDTTVDLRVFQPDGTPQADERGSPCLTGPAKEIGTHVLLCETSMEFFAAPEDPAGDYTVEVVLRDLNRGVEVPLQTRFRLIEVDAGAVPQD